MAAVKADGVSRAGEVDRVFGVVGAVADDDAFGAVLAFLADEVVAGCGDAEDQGAGPVGDFGFPVSGVGPVDGGGDNLEVERLAAIGGDPEAVIEFDQFVFDAGLSCGDDLRGRGFGFGGEEADFAGGVVVGVDEDEAARQGLVDADEEAGVFLAVDQVVAGLAQLAAADGDRAGVFIAFDPVDRAAVGAPDEIAVGAFDFLVEVFVGFEVADADGVEFRALVVEGVGQEMVIWRMRYGAQVEVITAFSHDLGVEQELFVVGAGFEGDGGGLTCIDRVFAALAEAPVVGPGTIEERDG